MCKSVATLIIFLFFYAFANAQENYGLTFNSFNAPQENRTSLGIGTDNAICFSDNSDISFDFYFIPNRMIYFGYIFRMINNSGQNIDLLYNEKNKIFNTISAGIFTGINFSLGSDTLFKKWTRVRYHFSRDSLSCYINEQLCKTIKISLKDKCFKILFGANNSQDFSTTDAPPMVIKNIAISESNQPKYLWTLQNSESENIIYDSITNQPAILSNPVWSEALHKNWQLLKTFTVNGDASVAYNDDSENLYIVSADSVYHLGISDVISATEVTPSKTYRLFQGNQSVYNTSENKLYNFYIDIHAIAGYSLQDYSWDKKIDTVDNTEYGHTNRVFVKEENALYIFGGYGQMKYKNQVQRYDFNIKQWTNIEVKGDYFIPRYLGAAGKSGNHIYIIGGYGSTSGDQVLNPGYLYDLMDFDIKDHTFKKLYSLKEPDTSFVFAGSMVIDSVNKCYYALCFDRSKYDTKLHLIKGSLVTSQYQFLATDIPYAFHDVVSDADLFYSANTKQLIAVTQLIDLGKQSTIKIYSIAFPPMALDITEVSSNSFWIKYLKPVIVVLLVLLLLAILIGYRSFVKKQKTKTASFELTEEKNPQQLEKSAVLAEQVKIAETNNSGRSFAELADKRPFEAPDFINEKEDNVFIYLFGDFEIIDTEGTEINKQFSPLLKEMFLVILLNTLKGKGISSEKLNEIFWENKTGKNAKNNLSVNIVRLKSILSKVSDIHIVKNGERWECEYDSKKVRIDIADFLRLRSMYPNEHGREYLSKMLYFISRGAFLKQAEYAWLDNIKADISNKIIDELLQESKNLNPEKDAEYIIEVANGIFNFDSLNEDALHLKCRTLDRIGRHSIAKATYERFAKEYKKSYGEDFAVSFNDIIK